LKLSTLRLTTILVVALVVAGFIGLLIWWTPVPDPPWKTGELVVLTRNSPRTYYLDADGNPVGFEHDLATLFAQRQGWKVGFVLADSLDDLFARLKKGQAHLAAAGLAVTDWRLIRMDFGPVYAEEPEVVVCGPTASKVRSLGDLVGLRFEVMEGSSHVDRLKALRRKVQGLTWKAVDTSSEDDLLERVSTGLADCAMADDLSYQLSRNFLPTLRKAFELDIRRQIAWAIPKAADSRLLADVQAFFKEIKASGELDQLRERYFGHLQRLAEADVVGILERRTRLLPDLKPFFYRAQMDTGIDWRLLAALAYQESQWDANAVSSTRVRGIMMLTEDTADVLNVNNRLDPAQSVLGGARYLSQLKQAIPDDVPEPDRTWMALAAYNIGPNHLADARRLAAKLGRNPNSWKDLKDVLPLLSRSRYTSRLRYGYARGGEARALTENVRIYYDILVRYEKPFSAGLGS
jgi:peptidoglycan lytic transglycosylase F